MGLATRHPIGARARSMSASLATSARRWPLASEQQTTPSNLLFSWRMTCAVLLRSWAPRARGPAGSGGRWRCKNSQSAPWRPCARLLPQWGGVSSIADPRIQLEAPGLSYHHFFTMDFMILDPPLNFPIEFHDDVKMKCDYNVIASTLAAVGAVCRLNRFTVDAPHYRVGGASTAADRWSSDRKAARWLIRRFGAGVFRLNPRRGGGTTQVLFSGLTLLTRSALGGSVAELHTALSAAMEPTKLTRAQAQAAIGARLQLTPTQIKRSRALKPSLTKSRARRGACVRGVKRAAGRKPHGSRAMTMAERQRIARARKALCATVGELRHL